MEGANSVPISVRNVVIRLCKTFIELPIRDVENTKIYAEMGLTKFECEYGHFLDALNDESYLYQLLLIAHTSLVEEFGRTIVTSLLEEELVSPSDFPGMKAVTSSRESAEGYIMHIAVENWGNAILATAERDWNVVPGGIADVVHAFVARNIVAHGEASHNQTAVNRLNGVAPGQFEVMVGTPLSLKRDDFQTHLSRLRNFSRVICGVPSRVRRRKALEVQNNRTPSKSKR